MADLKTVPGMATVQKSSFRYNERLFNGTEIHPVSEEYEVAAGQAIEAYTPVQLDFGENADEPGRLVEATRSGAIGFTMFPVDTTDGQPKLTRIFIAGVVNPAALNWPAFFDTQEKKVAAFRGAQSPTNILVKPNV